MVVQFRSEAPDFMIRRLPKPVSEAPDIMIQGLEGKCPEALDFMIWELVEKDQKLLIL